MESDSNESLENRAVESDSNKSHCQHLSRTRLHRAELRHRPHHRGVELVRRREAVDAEGFEQRLQRENAKEPRRKLRDVTKHASFKVSCGRQFGEFDLLLWIWSGQTLNP